LIDFTHYEDLLYILGQSYWKA